MKTRGGIIFLVVIVAIAAAFLVLTLSLPTAEDRILPLCFSVVLIVVSLVELRSTMKAKEAPKGGIGLIAKAEEALTLAKVGIICSWLAIPVAGIILFGFRLTLPLFMIGYMKLSGRGWLSSLAIGLVTTVFLIAVFEWALRAELYRGLIFEWFQ